MSLLPLPAHRLHAKLTRARRRYGSAPAIDTLGDSYLEQLLNLMESARAAEINYRNMIGQGAP